MNDSIELRNYRAPDGRVPYADWLDGLDGTAADKIEAAVSRIRRGNFGDFKPVGAGVSELRIHSGPGYRVYYLRDGKAIVLLLCGGKKGSQEGDIRRAHSFAADYWRRR